MVLISALSYRWIAGSARIPLTAGAYPARCLLMVFTGFHGSVIKLQSQNSEVLRILIYTRLKINKKINLWTSFLPRSLFRFENSAIWTSSFSQCVTPILNRIAVALKKSLFSCIDFQQSTGKLRGTSLQRIQGTKVLVWDQARSDQAPNWDKKGEKKYRRGGKKRLRKAADTWVCYFLFHPVFALFPQCGAWSQAAIAHAREPHISRVVTRYIFGQLIPHPKLLQNLNPDPVNFFDPWIQSGLD